MKRRKVDQSILKKKLLSTLDLQAELITVVSFLLGILRKQSIYSFYNMQQHES